MATGSSLLVITKSYLPQSLKKAEIVMTTCWLSKEPVITGPDPAEVDVPSSTDELPIQQTTFLVGELVTGYKQYTTIAKRCD